jgi:hypothetical protein
MWGRLSSLPLEFLPEFCIPIRAFLAGRMGALVQDCRPRASNPLLGGAEAEGFGVGIHHREPTPALCATPPGRGFPDALRFRCKIQVETPDSGLRPELGRLSSLPVRRTFQSGATRKSPQLADKDICHAALRHGWPISEFSQTESCFALRLAGEIPLFFERFLPHPLRSLCRLVSELPCELLCP